MENASDTSSYGPILLQFILAFLFVALTMVLTHLLGPKLSNKRKLAAFECGIESKGNARQPFAVKYFLVAILFVLFDVEVIFLYPWAVNFKQLGWLGFIEMIFFLAFLLLGFVYIIKKKVLEWK